MGNVDKFNPRLNLLSNHQPQSAYVSHLLHNKIDTKLYSEPEAENNPSSEVAVSKWSKLKSSLGFKKNESSEENKLSFRQKLAKMGLSVVLSYGFVSNMSYCVTVSLAWYGFCTKTKLSPLAPGQWKPFLAVYA